MLLVAVFQDQYTGKNFVPLLFQRSTTLNNITLVTLPSNHLNDLNCHTLAKTNFDFQTLYYVGRMYLLSLEGPQWLVWPHSSTYNSQFLLQAAIFNSIARGCVTLLRNQQNFQIKPARV